MSRLLPALRLLVRAWLRGRADRMALLAAGIAFYTFLSLFPALVAFEFLYALVAGPGTTVGQVQALTSVMPEVARDVLAQQLLTLADQPRPVLGVGLVIAILVEFWSASSVVANVVGAIGAAHHLPERRGVVVRRVISLGMTCGMIAFLVGVAILVVVAPGLIDQVVGPGWLRWPLEVLRWTLIVAWVVLALSVVYWISDPTSPPRPNWRSPGGAVAVGLWLLASAGFSLYAATLGNYTQSFGVFGGVVVLVLWLWLSIYSVLLGAELNAVLREDAAGTVAEPISGPTPA